MANETSGLVSLDTLAKLLMLTENRVLQLVKAGWIPRASRGMYPLVAAVQGYIKFLKDEEKRRSQTVSLSRVQEAPAAGLEAENARKAGLLMPVPR